MRVGKMAAIAVVGIASLILVVVAAFGIIFSPFRSTTSRNELPPAGPQARAATGDSLIFSEQERGWSFLTIQRTPGGPNVRLTTAKEGIESEPRFSHDGKLVVYSFADSEKSSSAIWIVGVDGSNAHAVTDSSEDALHPMFTPDDASIIYAVSNYTGHHSPLVGPARHDWDLFSRPVKMSAASAAGLKQLTHSNFYDLRSIDVSNDSVNAGGIEVLISTTGYPIGALIEELRIGPKESQLLYQPRVPGMPAPGPSYGEAYFADGGLDIAFLAATNESGEDYDYNVFMMSEVTGAEIKQLTHLHGMTEHFVVYPDGSATLVNAGTRYSLDLRNQTLKVL